MAIACPKRAFSLRAVTASRGRVRRYSAFDALEYVGMYLAAHPIHSVANAFGLRAVHGQCASQTSGMRVMDKSRGTLRIKVAGSLPYL
jgi:hypothetical protein